MPRVRLTVAVSLLACVSLAQQAAFAQNAVFEETKPHVDTGRIGLEPIPDPIVTDQTQGETPCPCRNGGDLASDEEVPLELLILLTPRLDVDHLRDGEDVALVYADVPGLEPDAYLLRLYKFEDGFVTTLVNWDGDETVFDSDVLISEGDDGPLEGFGCTKSGGYCCLTVCGEKGCAWICITKDLVIYTGADTYD